MRCGVVHEALTAIGQAEDGAYISLDYRIVSSLKEEGLVSAYSTWFYQEMVSSAAKLEVARTRLKDASQNIELAENLRARIKKLEAMPVPGGHKPTFDGDYVRLTEMGELVKAHLSGRQAELDDIVLEDMIRELEGAQTTIDAQYSRFTEMLDLMLKDGFRKEYNDVIDCAVRLSTIEGPVPEIYRRMRVINNYFHKQQGYPVFNYYNRLIPAFAAARQDGDIETLKEGLIKTYGELVRKGYYKNFYTWWLAADLMKCSGKRVHFDTEALEEIREAITKESVRGLVRDALINKGWEKWERHTDYMAINLARLLARRHASPEELARNLRIQQLRLASTGRTDGADLGTAGLILLDSGLSLEERTDRFLKTFEEMAASGWEKHSNFYPAAAALSLLPGSAAENVVWLGRIIKRLRADGFADEAVARAGHKDGLTYRALPLLMAAYKGQFSQEVMPSIITHINDPLFQS